MPGPLQAAGAAPEATEYASLTMDRYITGLFTQRSPLRDADVPYLYGKFYSATRFDSLIDGLNREVTSRLTMARRPGIAIWNGTSVTAPINSFYSYKWIQNNVQQLRVLADMATHVSDVTPPGVRQVFLKNAAAQAAGARTRFQGVGTELFMSDGYDQVKWLQSAQTWQPNTAYSGGNFIIDPNGNIQYVMPNSTAIGTATTVATGQYTEATTGLSYWVTIVTFNTSYAPAWVPGTTVTFQNFTGYPVINGVSVVYKDPYGLMPSINLGANQSAFFWGSAAGGGATGGTVQGLSSDAGTSGSTQPTWATNYGAVTTDGPTNLSTPPLVWTCFGPNVQSWGIAAPGNPPLLSVPGSMQFWMPQMSYALYTAILDSNGNLQVVYGNPGPGNATGMTEPNWASTLGTYTTDGSFIWMCAGNPGGGWAPSTLVRFGQAIVDTNNNLQVAYSVLASGVTGTTMPPWQPTRGNITADNAVQWINCGPGVVLRSGSVSYGYSYHCVDGTVSTISPLATIPNGILSNGQYSVSILLTGGPLQCDQIYIWRTPQGGASYELLAEVPNPELTGNPFVTYIDTSPDSALNPLITAPLNHTGDPPPLYATAPAYYLQRIWMIVGDQVIWSGGPDTVTGNGLTVFPPANVMQFPEAITRLIPVTTNSGSALLVQGTANAYAILGTTTSTFYPITYMATVGCLNYDAITVVSSTIYMFTQNSKFVSLDPSAGYTECGFPIGDQFVNMTTGGQSGALFNPARTYVTWYEKNSGDTGIYVADGNVGWFRYSPVAAPESGYLWSPFAAITYGTSAVQAVETSSGVFSLLIGPASGNPLPLIMFRNAASFMDSGVPYPSWMTIGNVVLCQSGEVAEIAHVALQSMRVGNRPTVGMLYDEIAQVPSAGVLFDTLQWTSVDPPNLPESNTLYSDRYATLQDGETPKCTHVQILIQWPTQNAADELLTHTIYGAKFGERKQSP